MPRKSTDTQARRSSKRPFLAMLRKGEAPAFLKRMRSNKTGKRNLATKLAEALEEIELGYAFEVDADAANDRLRDDLQAAQELAEGMRRDVIRAEKVADELHERLVAEQAGRRADNLKAARTINAMGEINGRAIHEQGVGRAGGLIQTSRPRIGFEGHEALMPRKKSDFDWPA